MSQETRNKIYGVIASVLAILVLLGVIDQATSDEFVSLANSVLDITPEILGLAATILAFVKSLPSRVTTVEVPKNEVVSFATTSGVQVVRH